MPLSELEYLMLIEAMTGCVLRSHPRPHCVLIAACDASAPPRRHANRKPAAEEEAWALLRRMKDDLRLVASDLSDAIRTWFASLGDRWALSATAVNEEGVPASHPDIKLLPVCRGAAGVTSGMWCADSFLRASRASGRPN